MLFNKLTSFTPRFTEVPGHWWPVAVVKIQRPSQVLEGVKLFKHLVPRRRFVPAATWMGMADRRRHCCSYPLLHIAVTRYPSSIAPGVWICHTARTGGGVKGSRNFIIVSTYWKITALWKHRCHQPLKSEVRPKIISMNCFCTNNTL